MLQRLWQLFDSPVFNHRAIQHEFRITLEKHLVYLTRSTDVHLWRIRFDVIRNRSDWSWRRQKYQSPWSYLDRHLQFHLTKPSPSEPSDFIGKVYAYVICVTEQLEIGNMSLRPSFIVVIVLHLRGLLKSSFQVPQTETSRGWITYDACAGIPSTTIPFSFNNCNGF